MVLALCSKVREEVAMKSHAPSDLVSKVQAVTETLFYGLKRHSEHLTLTVSENTAVRTEMLSKPLSQEGCSCPSSEPPTMSSSHPELSVPSGPVWKGAWSAGEKQSPGQEVLFIS